MSEDFRKVAAVAAIGVVGTLLAPGPQAQGQDMAQGRRFGFSWVLPSGLLSRGYTPTSFFNGMFLTPPYPSAVTYVMDIPATTRSGERTFLKNVMTKAAPFNIKQHIIILLDDPANQISAYQSFVSFLASQPSKSTIESVGLGLEFFANNVTLTKAQANVYLVQCQSISKTAGFKFISDYPQGLDRWFSKGSTLWNQFEYYASTNYPGGDNQNTLEQSFYGNHTQYVGIEAGIDGHFPFPDPGCAGTNAIGKTPGLPGWTVKSYAEGFNAGCSTCGPCNNVVTKKGFPPTIQQIFDRTLANPIGNRKYTFFIAGNNGSDFSDRGNFVLFTGVSGRLTYYLWDHPLFRSEMDMWLKAHPNVFVTAK